MGVNGAPCARGTILLAFKDAALACFGETGLAQLVALLPEDARRETVDALVLSQAWLPEAHVMAWYEAAFHGPCKESMLFFNNFLDRMMDNGWGRVQKIMLSFVSPHMLVKQAAKLWRNDHTTGELVSRERDSGAELRLTDHPYVTTDLSRAAIAEILRYAAALSRIKNVTQAHRFEAPGSLVIELTWSR